MKRLMSGNEAIARGAYEAGVHFACAYPGTPSTEILEYISKYSEIISEWAPNEKVALESSIGASFVGGRSLTAMKHVGVNVAADPLFTFAYTGLNAGSVLITADEPGMFSSQNEQDNRNYAKFAKIPMYEPSDSQEAKDMLIDAYNISEMYGTIVMLRLTTRVCHSKSLVAEDERANVEIKPYEKNLNRFVSVPSNARKNRMLLEERMKMLKELSENIKWNKVINNKQRIGVITSGMSYHHAVEALGDSVDYLKLGFTNPLPVNKIKSFCDDHETVYIIEENDPYIEEFTRMFANNVYGKDVFPYTGEMTPDVIKRVILTQQTDYNIVPQELVVPRPPTFCSGCPHRGFFYELARRRNKIIVAGDIGCYSLAVGEPYLAMDWLVCMGAAFSSGHGAQKIMDLKKDDNRRVVAIMGDSTFFHTGINSLINSVYNNGKTINIILDNRITGMTGQQDNPGSGFTLSGENAQAGDIEAICIAIGIKHVRKINPNDLTLVKETIDWALGLDEASVIITNWPCVLKRKYHDEDYKQYENLWKTKDIVIEDKCTGCKVCLRSGCPSLIFNSDIKKVSIDSDTCVGCDVCIQICPFDAIVKENPNE